jgi:hypothetical protein
VTAKKCIIIQPRTMAGSRESLRSTTEAVINQQREKVGNKTREAGLGTSSAPDKDNGLDSAAQGPHVPPRQAFGGRLPAHSEISFYKALYINLNSHKERDYCFTATDNPSYSYKTRTRLASIQRCAAEITADSVPYPPALPEPDKNTSVSTSS